MIKAIIIDDEAKARRMLETLLTDYCEEVQIVATAADVPSGVIAVQQHRPDVLFLDVEMPGYTGFQLLDFFREVDFEIVFTTAHSDYAVQAFRVSAIDFLLKPIQISELQSAVKRVREKLHHDKAARMEALKTNLMAQQVKRLVLSMAEGVVFVDTDELLYLQAEGAYTRFVLNDGRVYVVSKKIKEYEEALSADNFFFRIHRSYIINLKMVSKYVKSEGGFVILRGDIQLPLARERKDDFVALMEQLALK
ncbi:MAG: LytTR family DNA-binding domain-containing protein [Chitinophagales bacterium]